MTRKLVYAFASAAAIALTLSSCTPSGGNGGGGEGDADRVLQIRMSEDPGVLDPHVNASAQASQAAGYMYDTLIGQKEDGTLVPRLVSEWEADATSATMKLRDDVTCSDGTPLTPSIVAANFERVRTEAPLVRTYLGSVD